MSIIIFSRPIRSGKTTELMQWCSNRKVVQGILMPDINDQRVIYDIATKEIFPVQCLNMNTNEELITVGQYRFFAGAFKKANEILLQAFNSKPEWMLIDEIGKLELQKKGFYDSTKTIIDHYKNDDQNLLLVVRDSLVNEVIEFFQIKDSSIINKV